MRMRVELLHVNHASSSVLLQHGTLLWNDLALCTIVLLVLPIFLCVCAKTNDSRGQSQLNSSDIGQTLESEEDARRIEDIELDYTDAYSQGVINTTALPILSPNTMHANPYPFHVIMSPTPCTDERVVIVVHSAIQYYPRRVVMRSTWLNRRYLEKELELKIKIVFMTGTTNDQIDLAYLSFEQEMYHDIVQSDFIDTYTNNTYKAISYMRWVTGSQGCPNSSLILKVDDDALIHPVHIARLKETMHRALNSSSTDVYLGRLTSLNVSRKKTGKWYIPYSLWPREKFPVWFQGLAYMLTTHLAARLYPAALDTPYLFTDDAYVGVLVNKTKGVDVIIENLIGCDSREWKALKTYGRMFHHMPKLGGFYKLYNIKDHAVRQYPLVMPNWPPSLEDNAYCRH